MESSISNSNNNNPNQNYKDQPIKINSIHLEENKVKKSIEYDNINNNKKFNIEMPPSDEYIDRDLREAQEKFEVPLHLKKTFIYSLILFIVGATLIGIGFIEQVAAADPGQGITFWSLGGIVMIPGGYYSYQFYKAKKTRDINERDDILNEIPVL